MSKTTIRSSLAIAFLSLPASALAQSTSTGDAAFISISGGEMNICAVDIDGEVSCNQTSDVSRIAPPESLPAFVTVESGSVHACGLTLSGSAICWGDNDFGQLDVPSDTQFSAISAGSFHTCGVTTSNDVVCWGLNSNNQSSPRFVDTDGMELGGGEPIQFVALDLADRASCGLDVDSNIRCWGNRVSTYRPQSTAADAPLNLSVEKFAVAKYRFPFSQQCGLLSDGTIDCLENNYTFDGLYTDLAASGSLMCALNLDGDLECQAASFELDELREWAIESVAQINAGEPLVSIEGNFRLCGLTASAAAVCLLPLNSSALDVPGSPLFVPAAPLNLTAAIYSDTTIELLWSDSDIAPWRVAYAEIFRDGELLSTTTQLRSYIDASLEPGRSYTYRVRFVAVIGDNGDFSSTITVNTQDRDNPTLPPVSGYSPPERASEPTGLFASVYSQELLELQWSRVPSAVLGYEIRRDGQYMGYTTGVSYLDRTISSGGDYVYEVIAVNRDGDIQGVAMTRAVVD